MPTATIDIKKKLCSRPNSLFSGNTGNVFTGKLFFWDMQDDACKAKLMRRLHSCGARSSEFFGRNVEIVVRKKGKNCHFLPDQHASILHGRQMLSNTKKNPGTSRIDELSVAWGITGLDYHEVMSDLAHVSLKSKPHSKIAKGLQIGIRNLKPTFIKVEDIS